MILKTFDPKKADAIFAEEGETPSWLAELIGKSIFQFKISPLDGLCLKIHLI